MGAFLLGNWELLVKVYLALSIVILAGLASILTRRHFFSGKPASTARKSLAIALWLACILELALASRRYFFARIGISDDFYIRQRPFVSRYDLMTRGGETLVPDVFEWKETEGFLYGSGWGERYFIYSKEKGEATFFDGEKEFWSAAQRLGLRYGEGVCDTVADYFDRTY